MRICLKWFLLLSGITLIACGKSLQDDNPMVVDYDTIVTPVALRSLNSHNADSIAVYIYDLHSDTLNYCKLFYMENGQLHKSCVRCDESIEPAS